MVASEITASSNFKVYFTSHSTILAPDRLDVNKATVVFWPIQGTWNDFIFKSHYIFKIFPALNSSGGDTIITGNLYLGFIGPDERIDKYGRVPLTRELLPAEKLPQFFTLQYSMADYRNLVKKIELKRSVETLLSLHDLVAYRQKISIPEWVEQAEKAEVFSLAFMRNSETFYAFHNASTILSGLESEELGGISKNLTLNYKLDGFSNEHRLDLNFDPKSILPKRINILIGRNGLGKSQALCAIVNSMLDGGDSFSDPNRSKPMFSRILAVATPGETNNTFPEEGIDKKIIYKRLTLDRNLTLNKSLGFGEVCVQLARSEEYIGRHNRWDLFLNTILELDPDKTIVIPLDGVVNPSHPNIFEVEGKKFVPLARINSSGELSSLEVWGGVYPHAEPLRFINGSVYPLSSGQWAFLKFAVQACLYIENGTLVLLDEPETHLHPNFITRFVKLLDNLLESTGSVAVIASHSAYLVREMPRSQVLVFKMTDANTVDIRNPRLKTFGADVGAISFFVFEDSITNALADTLIEQLPEDKNEAEKVIEDLNEELSSEVIMNLRRRLNIGDQFDNN